MIFVPGSVPECKIVGVLCLCNKITESKDLLEFTGTQIQHCGRLCDNLALRSGLLAAPEPLSTEGYRLTFLHDQYIG